MKLPEWMAHGWRRASAWSDVVFPRRAIFARALRPRTEVGLLIVLAAVFSGVGRVLPADGFFAFDWVYFFERGWAPLFYPPWVPLVVSVLSWPVLVGLTLAAFSVAVLKRSVHPLSTLFTFLTLPLFWTIFLGQLEGLVVLGLLSLPWLAPLALLKPQVSFFAFGERLTYLIGLAAALGVSFLIWGFWPLQMLTAMQVHEEGGFLQNIALRWWGWPVAIPLLWWSRGDMDMLMTAGSFGTLSLIPYNLLPVVPAISRLPPRAAALASLFSWLPLSANWLGPRGWWLGWLFIAWLWLNLAVARYPQARFSAWLRRFVG